MCSMSQIQVNSEFINERRLCISFLPNDPAATTFLEVCVFSVPSCLWVTLCFLCFYPCTKVLFYLPFT